MQEDIVLSASPHTTQQGISFGLIFFSSNEAPFGDDKYRLVIESSKYADAHGFSSVWIPERHFTKDGWLYPNPVVLQAALARETKQIGLRAGSVVLPLHNPIRVAEEWAMVDNLSNGRVGLSFASGWHPNDFALFPEHYSNRNEVMYRGIETVKKLWRGETIQVQGGDGKQVEIRTYPTPLQPELPIWVTAAGNPKTFIGAGEVGANLLTHMYNQSIDELAEKLRLYREARARHGYDPQTGQVSVMMHTFIGETLESVQEQIRIPFSNYLKSASYLVNAIAQSRGQQIDLATLSEQDVNEYLAFVLERLISNQRVLFGTPESCYEQVMQMKAAGVTEIACQMDFGVDIDLVLQSMPYLNALKERCNPQQLAALSSQSVPEVLTELQKIQRRCTQEVVPTDFYDMLSNRGVQFGMSFQGIQRLWRGKNEALGQVQLPDTLAQESERYQMHPALLDACFQVLLAALPVDIVSGENDALYLPTGLHTFTMHSRPGQQVWCRSVLKSTPISPDAAVLEGDVFLLDDEGQVLVEATGLRLQRSEPVSQDNHVPVATSSSMDELKEWLYQLQWEPSELLATPQTHTPQNRAEGKWLIFADSQGVGQHLADMLAARLGKEQVVLVSPGYSYQPVGANRYRINPASAEDIRRVLKETLANDDTHLAGVVHLWSLDMTPTERLNEASLEADQVLGSGSALHLIQGVLARQQEEQGRLWFVTRGTQAIESVGSTEKTSLQVAQSPLWGLGRTCAIEHPELWGGLIDLDSNDDATMSASHLLTLLSQQTNEDQIAIREGQSYVARMVRSQEWTPTPLSIQHNGTYLITGGLWGLGLEVAHWLVRKGARHLVLLGRSTLPARSQWQSLPRGSRQAIQVAGLIELEQAGVHVHYASVDVANEEQMTMLLRDLPHLGFPAIRGVVHAASVWQDAQGESLVHPLVNLDPSSLQTVFRPKVKGAWLLHSLVADSSLDFFVSFSSGASLFGSAAQGNYAAAGAFLDALAHQMRANGKQALSIDWGAVSETGFGATSEGQKVHEYWESHGIGRITPRHVLAALELLIPQQVAQVGVLKLNWQQLQEFFPQLAQLPLVSHLVTTSTQASRETSVATNRSDVLQSLLQVSQDERQERLEAYLSKQVAGVLRVPESKLDRDQPLTALGLDSLMAIELKNRIERELEVRISIVAFLQGPSIHQFTMQLLEQLPATPQLVQAARSPEKLAEVQASLDDIQEVAIDQQRAAQLLTELDGLSDDEVNALLHTMLQEQNGQHTEQAAKDTQHQTSTSNMSNTNSNGTNERMSSQTATQLLAQLDQLSDDEVESLLSQITQEGDR